MGKSRVRSPHRPRLKVPANAIARSSPEIGRRTGPWCHPGPGPEPVFDGFSGGPSGQPAESLSHSLESHAILCATLRGQWRDAMLRADGRWECGRPNESLRVSVRVRKRYRSACPNANLPSVDKRNNSVREPKHKEIMPTKINPCLWFDHQAEDAAHFYTGVFKDSKIVAVSRYPEAGQEIHGKPPGSVMTVAFELNGHRAQRRPHFQIQ